MTGAPVPAETRRAARLCGRRAATVRRSTDDGRPPLRNNRSMRTATFPPPSTAASRQATAGRAPHFGSVLCGVGPGTPSLDAARQAASFAAGGPLTLVALGGRPGVGPEWAELAAAFVLAGRDRDAPEVLEIPADHALPGLLLVAGRHDLLVVGAHDVSSARDDITRAIVHQSPVPVLVARPTPEGREVADRILVAPRDPADPALRVATDLGEQHGGRLETFEMPIVASRDRRDHTADAVLAAAERVGATLVVISSRGLAGIAGLRSVSAAVAARARCSVLVLRPSWRT
jgi:nucleotide-binding universal stress UspA family protein